MEQYHTLLKRLLVEGDRQYNERTGHLMMGKAGHQYLFDLRKGFPATTTKPLFFKGVAEELFWMARGERNVRTLLDKGVSIWNENAYDLYLRRHGSKIKKQTPEWNNGFEEYTKHLKNDAEFAAKEGDLGPIYGYQWRQWTGTDGQTIDQLKEKVINGLRHQPGTRYAIINAYKVDELGKMALAPCHAFVQFNIFEGKFLDVNMFQRSCDVFLGVPFNTASYALLGSLVAKELNVEMRELYHSFGNVHIYAGLNPRSDFLKDDSNLEKLRAKVSGATERADFLDIRQWYLNSAPPEDEGKQRTDHVPFILEQLSIEPRELPALEILADNNFFELINRPASEVVRLKNYHPAKWDSKARMAV